MDLMNQGHTSSLFPFIDNDDGSAYFSAVGNVGIYGGGAGLPPALGGAG